jgi:hypothetical protein
MLMLMPAKAALQRLLAVLPWSSMFSFMEE